MIRVPRINYREELIRIRDVSNNKEPYDLTEHRVVLTVKEFTTDGDEKILIQKDSAEGEIVINDPPEDGEVIVIFEPEDLQMPPSVYWYDIFVIDTSNDRVYSTEPQKFIVTPTVPGALL